VPSLSSSGLEVQSQEDEVCGRSPRSAYHSRVEPRVVSHSKIHLASDVEAKGQSSSVARSERRTCLVHVVTRTKAFIPIHHSHLVAEYNSMPFHAAFTLRLRPLTCFAGVVRAGYMTQIHTAVDQARTGSRHFAHLPDGFLGLVGKSVNVVDGSDCQTVESELQWNA